MRRAFMFLLCAFAVCGAHANPDCFVLREIRLEGRDAARFPWITDETSRYLRRCVDNDALKELTSTISRELIDRGFIATRIALPPQNISEGVLRLALRSTHVGHIKMIDKETGQPDEAWGGFRNAFPGVEGSLLNMRDIEQGLDQMKRLPSQEVTSTIAPVADEAEGIAISDLIIERTPSTLLGRLHGSLSVDNSGSREHGRTKLGVSASLDNPFALNDVVAVNASSGVERLSTSHRDQEFGLSYSVPVGYSLLNLSVVEGRFSQFVSLRGTRAQVSGSSESVSAQLQHVVWRHGKDKLTARGLISTRKARSFIEDQELENQRRRTTSAELGIHWSGQQDERSYEADIAYRQGVSWDAESDYPHNDMNLSNRPRMLLFDFGMVDSFKSMQRKLIYSTSVRGRYTPNATLSIDHFSVGGRGTVRGFGGDNNLRAESGLVSRNEIAMPFELPGADWAQAYVALDAGWVDGASAEYLTGRTLVGTALGLRSKIRHLQLDLTLAAPLYKPMEFEKSKWNIYASASYGF